MSVSPPLHCVLCGKKGRADDLGSSFFIDHYAARREPLKVYWFPYCIECLESDEPECLKDDE